ncbi:MAG: site-2 protease family protein [Pseudomonadota bacterium]
MFSNSTTVLRIFDIEIRLAASWFLIAALITWSLADQVFPADLPGLTSAQYLVLGVVGMLLFFASLLLHELAHAMVARGFGIAVPRITLFLFGGVAELGEEPDTARHEFWIAIAGPAMSVALAFAFWIASGLALILAGGPAIPLLLSYLAALNLILALFNLLPAFPLDGGRVLRAILWARSGDALSATETATRMGEFLGLGLVALGLLTLFQGGSLGGAWQILVGLFIILAARGTLQGLRTRMLLDNQTVADLMVPNVVTTDPTLSLADLVNRVMLPNRVSFVPVVEDGVLLGHIDTKVLAMIDRENWPNTQVDDVFIGLGDDGDSHVIGPDAPATLALQRMTESGVRKLVVARDRRIVGVLTLSDLTRVLHLLVDLKMQPQPVP